MLTHPGPARARRSRRLIPAFVSPMISGRDRKFYRIPMTLYKRNRLRMLARTRLRWKHRVVHRQDQTTVGLIGNDVFIVKRKERSPRIEHVSWGPTRSRGKSRALRPADDIMPPSRQRA